MIVGIATRRSCDDDMIARLQRLTRDALLPKLTTTTPFDGISNRFAALLRDHHMHERVWIPIQELHEIPFNGLFLIFEIR